MKKTNYTLIASIVAGSMFSVHATADTRANGATSSGTLASVGHRPLQSNRDGKLVSVTGELTTGAELNLTDVVFSDNESDLLSLDKMVTSTDKIKWYLVGSDNDTPSGTPAGEGKTFLIPADAAGKKIKVVYRIHTVDGSIPDAAFLPSTVLLNTATSGVTAPGGGDTDGTISAKLSGVVINVKYAANGPGAAPSDAVNGTDVQGTPVVGSMLEAKLTCAVASDCDNPETKYEFQWKIADAGTTNFTNVTGATRMTYQITGTQQNKLFQVEVTPKTTKVADAPVQKTKRR